ncbi:PQQ-binding-like beta-propeller repeat protein [Nonomuraea wenchangensis]|uniref:outer membrane protein assembly factor BamB family protein n=1 Tax=Nonomuraea wenchangensis TaxID=568860 RepID=UPI003723894F
MVPIELRKEQAGNILNSLASAAALKEPCGRGGNERLMAGRTVVMAAHRLRTARYAAFWDISMAPTAPEQGAGQATGSPELEQQFGELGRHGDHGGRLYASGGGGVVALDRVSGEVRWHRARVGGRAMAVNRDEVYAGDGDGYAYALDPATGKTRWRTWLSGSIDSVVIAAGGTVYVTDEAGRTYALDATSGKRRWSFLGKSFHFVPGHVPVAVTQDLTYILGRDKRLHALDSASGVQRWSLALPGGPSTDVVIRGERGYVGDEEGGLHAFDAVTGTDRWSFQTGAHNIGVGPVVAGDHIYVGGSNGILFALSAVDGTAG